MLHVAGRTLRREHLIGLVCRRLVAAQACFIGYRSPEACGGSAASQAHVANATLVGKQSVRGRERSLAVKLPLPRDSQPQESKYGYSQPQDDSRDAEGRERLEVIQIVPRA